MLSRRYAIYLFSGVDLTAVTTQSPSQFLKALGLFFAEFDTLCEFLFQTLQFCLFFPLQLLTTHSLAPFSQRFVIGTTVSK
ncbi:TPA: hypothetical protein DIU24_02995 [candidate division WWE3 bacterium]|uniref:Uncharacterized protein n=1 Tax=candidate division WWE3 bacterium TaxID=2053526 RepID=A0A656PPR1_UNCKA|nr:hypothetical protein [candidate division WWE3 bacterium]